MKYIKQVLFLVGCCGSAFAEQQQQQQQAQVCVGAADTPLCNAVHQANGYNRVQLAMQYEEETQTTVPGILTSHHVTLGTVDSSSPAGVAVPAETWQQVGEVQKHEPNSQYPLLRENVVTIKKAFLSNSDYVSSIQGLKTDSQSGEYGARVWIGTYIAGNPEVQKSGIIHLIDDIVEGSFFFEDNREPNSVGVANQEMDMTLQRTGTSFEIYIDDTLAYHDDDALATNEKMAIKLAPSEPLTSFKSLTTYLD